MALIRLARPADGPALAEIYRPAVAESPTSFELEPPDGQEMARRVERIIPRFPWLVCEDSEGVIGYAYGSSHRDRRAYQWSVEVSAYVRGDRRRRGVGRALYTSLFAILSHQGFCNAYAGIAMPNEPSVRLHLAVGFMPIGVFRGVGYKLGAWHDVAWFERALASKTGNPAPPIPLDQATSAHWLDAAVLAGSRLLQLRS